MTEITFHYIEIVYLYFSPPVLDQLQYKFLRLLEWYKRKMAMIGLPKLEQLFHGLLESPTISLSPCYCNSGHKFRFNISRNFECVLFNIYLLAQLPTPISLSLPHASFEVRIFLALVP